MQALLTAIAIWLSANFALPQSHDHPRIEFATAAQMEMVRYGSSRATAPAAGTVAPGQLPEVEALYDDRSRTIYLSKGWKGTTAAELSVLVHEMVHHLQGAAGLKYECPQAREELAYAAQDRWLKLFGRSLSDEFGVDKMTLFVRTKCLG